MADRRAEPRSRTSLELAPGQTAPDAARAAIADLGTIVRFRSQDGLTLAARTFDAGRTGRIPLLCLAGLSRNSRDFLRLGRYFSRHPSAPRTVVALDYRGRGLSDPDPQWRNYTPFTETRDVLAAMTALGIGEAVIVGTSRGGIVAMLLGALRPALIAGTVLNDIGPVIEGTGLARIKKYLSARHPLRGRDEALAAVRQVMGAHFPALTDEDWRAYAEATFIETPRGLTPGFDSKLLKTMESVDFSERIQAIWPQFMSLAGVPMLAIRGELSDLLSTRTLAAMAERHPDFEQLTIHGQGHAPLLRDLDSLERIALFANRCDRQRLD